MNLQKNAASAASQQRSAVNELDVAMTPIVDAPATVIHLGSDSNVYLRYRPGARVELSDFNDYDARLRAYFKQNNLQKTGLLVDLTRLASISKEARRAHADPSVAEMFFAVALLVRSSFAKAVGGFFIFLDQPSIPTRMFDDEAEARKWLLRMRTNGDLDAPEL